MEEPEPITLTPEEAISLLDGDEIHTFVAGIGADWSRSGVEDAIREAPSIRIAPRGLAARALGHGLVVARHGDRNVAVQVSEERLAALEAAKAPKSAATETTSPRVATLAARILGGGAYTDAEVRTLAGSALDNAADRGPAASAPAGEAERLLDALEAADASLATGADYGWVVLGDDSKAQGRGDTPLDALRAAFPEVGP